MVCAPHGVAYQADMSSGRVPYGADYFEKVQAYLAQPVAVRVNACRVALLSRHLPDEASILDIGAGSGAFVADARGWGYAAKGFDVMPETVSRLKAAEVFADQLEQFDAVTLWDTLEHLENPEDYLARVHAGAFLFASLPVFEDLGAIRQSKHYRPGEHLYYFTAPGFVEWMSMHRFRLLEQNCHEVVCGRESIGEFAFCRDLTRACPCGGEMQMDSFEHPRKPVEWFMRCRKCAQFGPGAADQVEARRLWEQFESTASAA